MAGSSMEFAVEASLGQGRRVLVLKRIGVFFALMSVMVALQALTLKEVKILVHGEETRTVFTAAARVGAALSQVGITLREGDLVEPAPEARLQAGEVINIIRAFPVQITVDGRTLEVRVTGGTAQDALAAAGIVLGKEDKVLPAKSQRLDIDSSIRVIRVTHAYETVEEAVPYKTERRIDPALDKGKTRVAREGVFGRAQRTMKLTYEDGKLLKRTSVSVEVVQSPVNKVVVVGARIVPRTVYTTAGKALRYTEVRDMLATAYEPGPRSSGRYADGVTATGARARKGVVAVDPKVIPLGTRVYIPGYGEAVAADTGGAIKGNRIDLCYNTVREALQFGRRRVKVYILAKDDA